MNIIEVKYICETNGYNLYRKDNNEFIKLYFAQDIDVNDPEIGSYSYGLYYVDEDRYQPT